MPGDFGIQRRELVCISRAVVRRYTDSYHQHTRPGCLRSLHHFREILLRGHQGQATQAVVRTEFQDDQPGVMNLEGAGQTLQAAAAGLSAHAGVDDLVSVTLSPQSLREQRNPTLLRPNAVGGTQTVAQHEDRMVGGYRVLERDEQQADAERPGASGS